MSLQRTVRRRTSYLIYILYIKDVDFVAVIIQSMFLLLGCTNAVIILYIQDVDI
jgi:hypothetical protein